MTGVLALHLIDRQILAILAEAVKTDLGLSDTQIGLMIGLGFSLLYSILGIPIARLADRADRGKIIALATAAWSLMTAVTGAAAGFYSMLLARMGVAVGEAGGILPLHSLVSDLYPEERRARAFAVVQLGGPIGILIAFFAVGALAAYLGWRLVFLGTGVLGVAFAVVLYYLLPEPRRGSQMVVPDTRPSRDAVRSLVMQPVYVHLVLGTALAGFGLYALISWMPSLLQRAFQLPLSSVGLWLGLSFGGAGALGVLAAGQLADRFLTTHAGAHALVPAVALVIAAPLTGIGIWSSSVAYCMAFLIIPIIAVSSWQAPIIAAVQKAADNDVRALASALMMFVLNLLGLGLGPPAVGLISDWLVQEHGADSLRYGLLVVPVALLWAAWHWFLATRHLSAAQCGVAETRA